MALYTYYVKKISKKKKNKEDKQESIAWKKINRDHVSELNFTDSKDNDFLLYFIPFAQDNKF